MIRRLRGMLVAVYCPGSGVPGPPRVPIIMRPISWGAAGLMLATSNVGEAGVWAYAIAQNAVATDTVRNIGLLRITNGAGLAVVTALYVIVSLPANRRKPAERRTSPAL